MTAPTTTTCDQLKKKQSDLIRKALEGSIFIADHTADLPTALTPGAGGDLLALPSGYEDIGWVDKGDGATWSRSVDTSEVNSWGAVEPTRTDITKQTDGLKFTAQETKRKTLELYKGINLSGVVPDATSGEVRFDRPSRPSTRYFRAFGLFVDGVGADAIYVAKLAPKATVTATEDSKWSEGDDPVGYGVTLTAQYDADAKTAMRFFFGGPDWKALLVLDDDQQISITAPDADTLDERGRQLCIGWPRLVVDALEKRIDLQGFRLGGQPANDTELDHVAQYNDLDAGYQQAHVTAMVIKRAYAIVGSNPGSPTRSTRC